jgi:hypothetical protein
MIATFCPLLIVLSLLRFVDVLVPLRTGFPVRIDRGSFNLLVPWKAERSHIASLRDRYYLAGFGRMDAFRNSVLRKWEE